MREKLIDLLSGKYMDTVHDVEDVVDILIANGVTIPVRCGECKHWMKDVPGCTEFIGRCEYGRYMIASIGYCLYGERKT